MQGKRRKARQICSDLNFFLEGRMRNHDCPEFKIEGDFCYICTFARMQKPLFLLMLLRRDGHLSPEILPLEQELKDIIGKEGITQKLEADIKEIRSYPRKKCSCGVNVTLWIRYSDFVEGIVKQKRKEFLSECNNCGNSVHYSRKDIPESNLSKFKKKPPIPRIPFNQYARNRAGRNTATETGTTETNVNAVVLEGLREILRNQNRPVPEFQPETDE